MSKFDVLKNAVFTDQKAKVKVTAGKNPTGLALRIYANGDVYPSQQLIDQFDLNYYNQDSQSGTGFDVIDSKNWEPTKAFDRMIIFGVVPKHEPKIDLFNRVKFNDNGTPVSNVFDQGSPSPKLLNLVQDLGLLKEGDKFVDLQIFTDFPITMEDGIALVPKELAKGGKKGTPSYQRRENVVFYPVDVVEAVTEEADPKIRVLQPVFQATEG